MRKFIRFLFFLLLFILIVLIFGRYEGTRGLITNEYKVETTNIDNSFDGLKIVQFSDLHYLRVVDKHMIEDIVKEINLIKPDIVFFTGDLIDKDYKINTKKENDLVNLLSNIDSKYGKYAIIGNHDYVQEEGLIEDIYERSEFTLLKNDYDIIYGNNNDKLFIGGVDTYSYDKADIDKTMEYFKNKENNINYKIILVHEPDYTDMIIKDYDVDLILSGHSHNGQVNIPGIKNFFLPYGSNKYYDSYYIVNNTPLYISSGIGESRINFRLFNKPSINFYRINKIET